jgi:selenide,water dikinase
MKHAWIDERTGPLDDAAVARPEGAAQSLALTIDVITPIVDDPFAFGAIAAANSLSDVYAMGGQPELALSFVGLPIDALPPDTLGRVLAGLHATCDKAGCAIVGGHTMKDSEPKCGLAVVGSLAHDGMWSQRFAQAGDVLLLSKRIGTGLVGQSVRRGDPDPEVLAQATKQMMDLNDVACEVGRRCETHACTDVTGFGLLGHLRHVVEASGVVVEIDSAAVPTFDGVHDLAREGCVPGGSRRNLDYALHVTDFDDDIDEAQRLVLADAQTSGGLLLSLPAARADEAVRMLHDQGCDAAAIIGRVTASGEGRIRVRS